MTILGFHWGQPSTPHGQPPSTRRGPSPHAHMPGLSESSSRAQTQTARRGGARSTHARRTGRSNTRARGTYLYTPARGRDQVCVVTYTHVDALAQMRTRAHAGNQSAALLGPQSPLGLETPLLHPESGEAFRAPGEAAGPGLGLCGWGGRTPLPFSPVPAPRGARAGPVTAAGLRAGVTLLPPSSANPRPRGRGEMTTTSAAFAVRRLHLDWPRHLWREGGQGDQGRRGPCGWGLPPELCQATPPTSPASGPSPQQPLTPHSNQATHGPTYGASLMLSGKRSRSLRNPVTISRPPGGLLASPGVRDRLQRRPSSPRPFM